MSAAAGAVEGWLLWGLTAATTSRMMARTRTIMQNPWRYLFGEMWIMGLEGVECAKIRNISEDGKGREIK